MFAGIGGFRAGLDRIGGFQCVGHCEIDKYADASYRAIHDIREEERYYPDARKIDQTTCRLRPPVRGIPLPGIFKCWPKKGI